MSSISTALRRFVVDVDRVFHSIRASFSSKIVKWQIALDTLQKRVRSIGGKFASLSTVKRVAENGEELVMLGGRIEAREFTTLLRSARTVEAYERATGTVLSPVARAAFKHMDDVAMLHFPDAVLARRTRYLADARESLVRRNMLINSSERITDAAALERLVRKDPETLKRVNALLNKTSKTKKILYVGGAITVGGLVTVAYLTKVAAEYAANNTGCFMYTQDLANGTKKCRVLGCSCPLSLHEEATARYSTVQSKSPRPKACDESNLWEKMHVRNNECDKVDRPSTQPYCVHCDWNENDSNSVNFVDRTTLPQNAYLICEHMDAVDALHEFIGSTVDDLAEIGSSVTDVAKNSLTSSAKIAPWLITGFALLVMIVLITYLWRFLAPQSTSSSSAVP